jgi:hypothetical protein
MWVELAGLSIAEVAEEIDLRIAKADPSHGSQTFGKKRVAQG